MSTREQILQGVLSALQTVAGLKPYLLFEATETDISTKNYPLALIYPSAERSTPVQTIGYETWDWDIVIELWDRGSKARIENYIAEITKAMYSENIHASVRNVKRTGVEYLYPEPQTFGAKITFTLTYFHPYSAP